MRRRREFLHVLDICLARMLRGEPVHRCLARYPKFEKKLRPLLEIVARLRESEPIAARPAAVEAGRERMFAALAEKKRAERLKAAKRDGPRSSYRRVVMAVVAVSVVISLLAFGNGLVPWGPQPVSASALATEVEGGVLRLPVGERTWVPVDAGDRVAVGERVQTLSDGRIKLKFHDGTLATVQPASEVVMLKAPQGWPIRRGQTILYQERGRVDVQMAGPASLDPPEGAESASFVMQTARLSAQAYGGDYSVMVAEDGSTTLAAGTALVQITVAGETRLLQPGQTHTERPAPLSSTIEPTGELDAEGSTPKPPRTGETSPDTGPPDEGPPGLEDREKETPPGLEDEDGPPGLEDKAGPPGLEDKDTPPGLEDKDTPPGLDDKEEPPGQEDKDTPPGLEDKDVPAAPVEDGSPPGLQDQVTPSAPDETDVPRGAAG